MKFLVLILTLLSFLSDSKYSMLVKSFQQLIMGVVFDRIVDSR